MLRDPSQMELLCPKKAKRNKFGAKKVRLNGFCFDSRAECAYYIVLHKRKLAGEIRNLQVHPVFQFKCGAKYTADFIYLQSREHDWRYFEDWTNKRFPCLPSAQIAGYTVIDVKGGRATKTGLYRRNKAMMKHEFGIEVQEVEVDPVTADTLIKAWLAEWEFLAKAGE